MTIRLMLIEDDLMIGETLVASLSAEGYSVDWRQDGQSAIDAFSPGSTRAVDLALLDLSLPGRPGEEVLRAIKQHATPIPVIVITAREASSECVKLLDSGADDYIKKPFNLSEMFARIRAALRKNSRARSMSLSYGSYTLDAGKHELRRGDELVGLSRREYEILYALMLEPGSVITHDRLHETVYPKDKAIQSNAMEVHIHSLRRKLGPSFIRSVRGVGYKLENL